MILLQRLGKRDDGQDLLEYAMLVSLIAIVVLASMSVLANEISTTFWGAIASLNF